MAVGDLDSSWRRADNRVSARQWVSTTKPKFPVKWRDLQLAAFASHPAVLDQLDPDRLLRGKDRLKLLLGVPGTIVLGAIFGAPIWGFTTLVGARFGRSTLDPAVTIPAAGIIFAVGLVALIVNVLLWFRAGKPVDRMREAHAGLAFFLGVPSILIAWFKGSTSAVEGWQYWIIPVITSTVIGGVFLAQLWWLRYSPRARAQRTPAALDAEAKADKPLARVTTAVELLQPAEQDAVKADLEAAISELEAQNVITPEDATVARNAELGLLALRMYQQSRRTRALG